MIEETHPNDDSYIVRVKAVLMTRDDSSGGWLAQDGGALCRVGVCRVFPQELSPALPLPLPRASRNHFLIHGERDKQVILECPLRKDLVYTTATPTFHHWKVEDRRCGLSFQSPADARAFDRGVRKAIEDLAEGSTTSSTLQNEAELGDDDVFTNTTDSSSNSSQRLDTSMQLLDSSPLPHRHNFVLGHRHDLHDPYRFSPDHYFQDQSLSRVPRHVTFQEDEEIVRINPRECSWGHVSESRPGRLAERSTVTGYEDYRHATVRDKFIHPDDTESYVDFAKSETHKHDYNYPLAPAALINSDSDPALGPFAGKGHLDVGHGFGSVVSSQPRPLLPGSSSNNGDKGRIGNGAERAHCEYCGETFFRTDNRRGGCHDAPDPVRAFIRRASCMWLADTLLYHCMSDPEGDYSDPCSCDGGDGGGGRLGTRWAALLGLSLVAPCLCLYPPLHACHRAGLACGCCGGRHKAAW
ncbi:sprouty-related, EVH1 domain-containing protein 2-like [Osmerus eperlanus]|uniref:sprouty-related, EVH1 domain-containing protein 2-like n=1 Tax=Osmerus eperlanus TaxID=29151 RepID=UPI002E162C76